MNTAHLPASQTRVDLFTLLGAEGTAEEKQALQDQVSDTVWQEVVDTAVLDKMTDEQMDRFETVVSDSTLSPAQSRAKLYGILLEIVPDLQAQLEQRTFSLMAELFQARLDGMREFFKAQPEALRTIDQADQDSKQGNWKQAATLLNTLSANQPANKGTL